MPGPTVLTIILNYKTALMTLRSVEAALAAMDGVSGEIIIVDNDSQDESFETILAHIEEKGWNRGHRVRGLQSGRNGGFGAGNNVGIRAGLSDGSHPNYVYVLNSDAFPAADAIRQLLTYLEAHPEIGLAGSYIRGEDGETHLTTFRFPSILSEFEGAIKFGPVSKVLANHSIPLETPSQASLVDWLAGASLMMRQPMLDEIGLFDETFFLYFEETDLCLRARQAGYRTAFVHNSTVTHIGSVSTGMKHWRTVPHYWFDSRLHYFVKNHGAFYAASATLAHLTGGGLHWLRSLVTRKPRDVTPFFLTTMAGHDLRTLGRALFLSKRKENKRAKPAVGE